MLSLVAYPLPGKGFEIFDKAWGGLFISAWAFGDASI